MYMIEAYIMEINMTETVNPHLLVAQKEKPNNKRRIGFISYREGGHLVVIAFTNFSCPPSLHADFPLFSYAKKIWYPQ